MSRYTELKKQLREAVKAKYGVTPEIVFENAIYTKNFGDLIGYGDSVTEAMECAYKYEGIKINRNCLNYDYENGFICYIYNEEICKGVDIDHDFGYTKEEAIKNLLKHI